MSGIRIRARGDTASGRAAPVRPAPRQVVFLQCAEAAAASEHDIAGKASVAAHLAALFGAEFTLQQMHSAARKAAVAAAYLVPSHTLHPRSLGRAGRPPASEDFFGGFVPHPFVATKLITHPLVHPHARAPKGWSMAYGARVADAVLPGRSVFTRADASRAAAELLALGAVRIKESGGVGGSGQTVIGSMRELDAQLSRLDRTGLLEAGLVLEQNLERVTTCSIGQIQVGPWLAWYHGEQFPTRNGRGETVYGGSTLTVFRGALGDPAALTGTVDPVRRAAGQALLYHREALRCFPGLVASRCNYDVLQGVDAGGRWQSGVLEQSWRIGGASGAEIAALHFLRDNPDSSQVRASTVEVYGAPPRVPAGAIIHFDGVDEWGDRLLKYAWIEPNDDDRQENPHPGR